jgi:tetratricopeptide (TPR) repeat protein
MDLIRGTLATLLAAAVFAAPAFSRSADPQTVRITRTNGTVVEGDLQGFENGKYRILAKDGSVEEIEETLVQEIVLTSALAPGGETPAIAEPARAAEPAPAADVARTALERGDTEAALQNVLNAMDGLRARRQEVQDLALRVYQGHLPKLLEKRDPATLADALRRLPEALPPEARKDLTAKLAERLAEQVRSAPDDPFTAAFAQNVARLIDEGSLSGDVRALLADRFADQGKKEAEAGNPEAAAALLAGALKLDPARREALLDRIVETAVEAGRRRLAAGDARRALEAAREALDLAPAHEPARRLLEDADFASTRGQVDATPGLESKDILKAFLARTRRPEHREWAVKTLAQLEAAPAADPAARDEMARFFPVKVGSWILYRRGDGSVQQKVRTVAATRTKESVRVRYVLQEIFRGSAVSKTYDLEIEKDSVLMATGREREVLLKFPLRAGDTWAWRSAEQEFRRTVKAVGQTVRTGDAGRERTFEDCAVIEFTSTSSQRTLTSRSTYAPGVGLVRLEFLDPEHRGFGLELVETGTE